MPANAVLGTQKPPSTEAFGSNVPYAGLEWRSQRDPDYRVYLFNISRRTFTNVGRIGRSGMTIPGVVDSDPTSLAVPVAGKKNVYTEVAGKPNDRYHYVTSLPQPFLMAKFNDESGMVGYVETDVRRVVVDLIDPDNLTLSLDASDSIRPDQRFSFGTNLAEKGVFFSLNNPPTKEDHDKARARMEKYYNRLLEQIQTLELTDKAKMSEALAGNPDYAFAADYFGKMLSWHKPQTRTEECPNCGEGRQVGRLFHISSDGGLCVEPSVAGWQAAVRAGRRTYDAVPDEFRWKKEQAAAPVAK